MKTVLAFRTAHLSHIIAMAPAIQSFNGEDTSASDAIAAVRIRLFLFFLLFILYIIYICVCPLTLPLLLPTPRNPDDATHDD